MHSVTVLTSKKNFAWMSMQEIIPYICNEWLSLNKKKYQVSIVDVSELEFKKVISKALSADIIVCSCFTVEIVNIVKFLRQNLCLDFKLYFYTHGLATVGMWPLGTWDLISVLKKSDVFVTSNSRDVEDLNLVFDNPCTMIHPFNIKYEQLPRKLFVNNLMYIGRVSEQKNIHTLIIFIGLLKFKGIDIKLDIVGGVDELGSPNMGLASAGYEKKLNDLVKIYNLSNQVIFHGHKSREDLEEYIKNSNSVCISLSLHSDENFGVVPYRFIKNSEQVILSDWGGYGEHKLNYPESVISVKVYKSSIGPFVSIDSLISLYLKLKNISKVSLNNDNEFNLESEIDLLNVEKEESLQTKPLFLELVEKRQRYYSSKNTEIKNFGSQVFESYSDENAAKFFSCYGARDNFEVKNYDDVYVLPFVTFNNSFEAFVDCPHRGIFLFNVKKCPLVKVMNYTFNEIEIGEQLAAELLKNGCAIVFKS